MLRALIYFESIFNEIIMIIFDVGTWYDFCGLNCQKGNIYKHFETSFSCFVPFEVWSVTVLMFITMKIMFKNTNDVDYFKSNCYKLLGSVLSIRKIAKNSLDKLKNVPNLKYYSQAFSMTKVYFYGSCIIWG